MQPVWVEMPVKDIDRAVKFYGAALGATGNIDDDGVRRTATLFNFTEAFPMGLSLNQTANFEPSPQGVLVYVSAEGAIPETLEKVATAGGKVICPKTEMGSMGFYAIFEDTEGNHLALYSMS